MKVTRSVSLADADRMTKQQLIKFFESVPDDAKLWIETHKGDYNQMDYHSMEFNWSEEL